MNWDLSPIPSHKRGDFGALGIYLWDQIEPENVKSFLTNSTRPLTSYQVPPDLIEDIARSMSETTLANTGFNIVFTPEIVIGCTPLSFVQLMRDYELIKICALIPSKSPIKPWRLNRNKQARYKYPYQEEYPNFFGNI